jgi:hypothetical protein
MHGTNFKEVQFDSARFIGACMVMTAHVAAICWLAAHTIGARRLDAAAEPMVAEVLLAERSDNVEAGVKIVTADPPIELDIPNLPISAQPELSIDSPRIDPSLSVDIAPYTVRAGLMPGFVATILLLLEIAPDGSVLSAEIVRSTAGDAANAAAIQYAHATHWMPGKVGGEPRAMQASLTVILGERG